MKRMYAWVVHYRNTDWAVVVIDTTVQNAKERFSKEYPDGEAEDIRCSNQRKADGYTPCIIASADDPRLAKLGFRGKKHEGV